LGVRIVLGCQNNLNSSLFAVKRLFPLEINLFSRSSEIIKVNRERKRCLMVCYENKVKELQDSKPQNWWREVNQLCGSAKSTGRDLTSILHPDLVCEESTFVDKINKAFVRVMEDYFLLTECVCVDMDDDQPISVTDHSVARKLREISCARAGGPDDLPNWVLKEYAYILAAPIAEILNTSLSECKLPRA